MSYTLSDEDLKRCRVIALGNRDLIHSIALQVSKKCDVPLQAIYGKSVAKPIVAARHLVMYLAHMAGLSYPAIGKAMKRDHTTVMDAVKREKARRALESETPAN
jgi:chromosomal replication initiation ATPase DnaA